MEKSIFTFCIPYLFLELIDGLVFYLCDSFMGFKLIISYIFVLLATFSTIFSGD